MAPEVGMERLVCRLLSECTISSLEFEGAELQGWVLVEVEFEVSLCWLLRRLECELQVWVCVGVDVEVRLRWL